MYLQRIFTADAQKKKKKMSPWRCSDKTSSIFVYYKYKNRLTTTRKKEEILICCLWHLLEVFFCFSEVVQIEHCPSNSFAIRALNSRMLLFGMFQRKICIVLLEELPRTIPKLAKQIAFPKNCPPRTLSGLIPY